MEKDQNFTTEIGNHRSNSRMISGNNLEKSSEKISQNGQEVHLDKNNVGRRNSINNLISPVLNNTINDARCSFDSGTPKCINKLKQACNHLPDKININPNDKSLSDPSRYDLVIKYLKKPRNERSNKNIVHEPHHDDMKTGKYLINISERNKNNFYDSINFSQENHYQTVGDKNNSNINEKYPSSKKLLSRSTSASFVSFSFRNNIDDFNSHQINYKIYPTSTDKKNYNEPEIDRNDKISRLKFPEIDNKYLKSANNIKEKSKNKFSEKDLLIENENLKLTINKYESKINEIESEVKLLKTEMECLKSNNENPLENSNNQLQINKSGSEIENSERKNIELDYRNNQLESNIEKPENPINNLESENKIICDLIIENENLKLQIKKYEFQKKSETSENESETSENESEISENESETSENESETSENESEISENDSETSENESETSENESENKKVKSEIKRLKMEIESLKSNNKNLQSKFDNLENSNKQLLDKYENMKLQISKYESENENLRQTENENLISKSIQNESKLKKSEVLKPLEFANPVDYRYLNSVVQVLGSCKEFKNDISNYKWISSEKTNDSIFVEGLFNLITAISECDRKNLDESLNIVQQNITEFSLGNNVFECFMIILTRISNIMKTNTDSASKQLSNLPITSSAKAEIEFTKFKNGNPGFVFDYFYGQLTFQTICTLCECVCNESFQVMKSLVLPVPNSKSSETLNNCIDMFFSESHVVVDEPMKCGCENQSTKSLKSKAKLTHGPKYFFIYLNRGSYTEADKNNTRVTCDHLTIDIKTLEEKSIKYKLISVIDHIGDSAGGHYYCKCSFESEKWWLLNDSHVYRLKNKNDIVTENTIVFLFKITT